MPDPKLLEAYKMAQQMDQQQAEAQDDYEKEQVDKFLKTIGMIESSGGKDFSHDLITSGMHKGHRASGTYGLMPNTVHEMLNRMQMEGKAEDDLMSLKDLSPDEMKQYIEQNPEAEQKLARYMAARALQRQGGDEEKAAYSWFQGHNLSPKDIESQNYQEHDYVKKFKKYRGEE